MDRRMSDLSACIAVIGPYYARFQAIGDGELWLFPLVLTADMVLPLLGAMWITARLVVLLRE